MPDTANAETPLVNQNPESPAVNNNPESQSANINPEDSAVNPPTNPEDPNHGWSFEHDELLATWGDHATCYTWMHDATQRKFSRINMGLGIPVIVLSTISGTANFGISSIFPAGFNYGNIIIGSLSLLTGVISTISNFLGYAQSEEAHRISAVQWSKFKRSIETELSINPTERKDARDFIKYCKAELDRLMEQSPIIPQEIIDKFLRTFRKIKNVKMPEICNKLEPTTVYAQLYDIKNNNLDSKIDSLLTNNKSSSKSDSNTDKNIIKSVSDKINKFRISSPFIKNDKNIDTISEESVIISVKDDKKDEIINYSNEINNNKSKPILNKQLIYGKK